jgi:hypothetical protein
VPHLKTGGHHADRLEDVVVEGGHVLEPAMIAGVLEQERCHSLLDDDRPSAILDLANDPFVTALATEQLGSSDR